MNKQKIINDPIFGFITIPSDLLFELITHPYMQRLNRIKQLGLSFYVYPGAQHTRFHHSLGAMHLMGEALETLKNKGHRISPHEKESALIAILLHDIGHGPYSHTLEHQLVKDSSHELITQRLIEEINEAMHGQLSTTLLMLNGTYERPFFHQLISGQLDVDRMDYLRRDSSFCGVVDGTIGSDRILKMLDLHKDEIVVEEKGLFSIEKFLLARRLMYWQVYLHKTAMVADEVLVRIIRRAKELLQEGDTLFCTPALHYFLSQEININQLSSNSLGLKTFMLLDDSDIISAVKVWCFHPDKILAILCESLIDRKLPHTQLLSENNHEQEIEKFRQTYASKFNLNVHLMHYFVFEKKIGDHLYTPHTSSILFKMKDGNIKDITEISDIINLDMLKKTTTKNYLCTLKPEQFI